MKYLLSRDGRRELVDFFRRARADGRLLLAFDFDGTLARIVDHPADARLQADVLRRLRELQARYPIAIVTGRAVGDLRRRLGGFKPDYVVGNHGMEGIAGPRVYARCERICRRWAKQLDEGLIAQTQDPGVWVEDKRYSLSLHYRKARSPRRTDRAAQAAVAALRPPARVVPGKLLLNLTPAFAPHKGAALRTLMRRSGARHAFFAGDEATDEDVFKLRLPGIFGLKIRGRHTERHSAAPFYLRDQSEMEALLRLLRDAEA